jgi:hypothetical protein
MGFRLATSQQTGVSPALPANATETAIITSNPITLPFDFSAVLLFWFLVLTAGASTTSFVVRLRRGATLASTQFQLAPWTQTVAAGNTVVLTGCYSDTPGAVAGQQYLLTLVQTAATAAGTVVDSSLIAMVL